MNTDKEKLKKAIKIIEKGIESGHAGEASYDYCSAIKGPDGENWTEEEDCDCWVKDAKLFLEEIGHGH